MIALARGHRVSRRRARLDAHRKTRAKDAAKNSGRDLARIRSKSPVRVAMSRRNAAVKRSGAKTPVQERSALPAMVTGGLVDVVIVIVPAPDAASPEG